MRKNHDHSRRSRRGVLTLAAIASVMACGADTMREDAVSTPVTVASHAELCSALPSPNDLRAAYIASVQREASNGYDATPLAPGHFRVDNRAQQFIAMLDGSGVVLSHDQGAWTFRMHAAGVGCEGQVTELAAADPDAKNNRIRYDREGLEEWYVNGPLGIEQGFVLREAPRCTGTKLVAVSLGGDLRAELADDDSDGRGNALVLRDSEGRSTLAYTDLYVKDATGRQLPAWLSLQPGRVAIHVDDTDAVYPVEIDPLVGIQQAKLLASDGAAFDELGISVAFSGSTALVGAHDSMGADAGAAYVFVNAGGVWVQEAKLVPSDGALNDGFGISVALSGDTALVGAWGHDDNGMDSGSAYVFVRSGGGWTEEAKLLANDGTAADQFGISVALDGDTALVGAGLDDMTANQAGSAYVFLRSAGVWTQEAKLLPSDGAADDRFGRTVALSADTALVGAHLKDESGSNSGSAYVFVRSIGVWTQQTKLLPNDGAADDTFGFPVAISGDTALLGASGDDDVSGANSGAAYVFVRSGSVWTQEAKLVANDGGVDDFFGYSVAVFGTAALVGAYFDDTIAGGTNAGSVYVFVQNGGVWTQELQLFAPDGQPDDVFGASVALSGSMALIGAWGDDDVASSAGSAYVFSLALTTGSACTADVECASTFCVDGVCCDTACGAGAVDCLACSVAAGATADGTCTMLSAGAVCRAAADVCDVAESCNGTSNACPADAKIMPGTECRAAAGDCDTAEACDGMNAACPPNVKITGTVCRMPTDVCDAAEMCDGMVDSCPPDVMAMPGTVCRMPVGDCDGVEVCTGMSDTCPADIKKNGSICRAGMGVCGRAETCDGMSNDCPPDEHAPEGTFCPEGSCQSGTCTPLPKPTESSGCGCTIPGANGREASWLLVVLLGLASLRSRRSPKRTS